MLFSSPEISDLILIGETHLTTLMNMMALKVQRQILELME